MAIFTRCMRHAWTLGRYSRANTTPYTWRTTNYVPMPYWKQSIMSFHATNSLCKKDYYDVLGVDRSASEAEMKKAYYRLAKKHHPDANPGDKNAAEKFAEINEAYEVLRSPEKRQMYDQMGHAGVDGSGGMPGGGFGGTSGFDFHHAEDIFKEFSDFFESAGGSGRGGSGRRGRRRGADIQTSLRISFFEAVRGCTKDFSVRGPVSCDTCQGSGARAGSQSRCTRCKGTGQETLATGFFMVQTTCRQCEGAGTTHAPCTSCHGQGTVKKTRVLTVKVPPGVDNDTNIRLANQGEAAGEGQSAGHLYVSIQVSVFSFFIYFHVIRLNHMKYSSAMVPMSILIFP